MAQITRGNGGPKCQSSDRKSFQACLKVRQFLRSLLFNILASLLHLNPHSRLEAVFPVALTLWSVWFLIAIAIALINLIFCFFMLTVLNRLLGHQTINPFQD